MVHAGTLFASVVPVGVEPGRVRRAPPARVRPPRDGPACYTGALRRVSASLGLHSVHFDKSSGALTRVAVPEDVRTRMEMPNALVNGDTHCGR